MASIERLKKSFGSGGERRTPELTLAEREQRKQKLIRVFRPGQLKQTGVMTDG